jgi:hypothetical protein
MTEGSERATKTKSGGPSRWATWSPAYAACGWALLYAAYRGYYALGGTVGMFGLPTHHHPRLPDSHSLGRCRCDGGRRAGGASARLACW